MGIPTNQGTTTTSRNESATAARQGNEDESRDDGKYDDTDEPKHDEHDVTNEPGEAINHDILQVDGNDSFISDSSEGSQHNIPVHISNRNENTTTNVRFGPQNLNTIKRSNKFAETFYLPKLCNINPQSVYNKQSEFVTFVEQMESDIISVL